MYLYDTFQEHAWVIMLIVVYSNEQYIVQNLLDHGALSTASATFLHRHRPVMLTIFTRPVVCMSRKLMLLVLVGTADGCGYNGQQKTLFVTFVDRTKPFKAHSS